jgi:hypothetical protein
MALAFVHRRRPAAMDDRSGPEPPVDSILAHLLLGGATELRVVSGPLWLVGRAPSGVVVELHYWPARGYSVTRRPPLDQPAQLLGVFPTWEAAVDRALQA